MPSLIAGGPTDELEALQEAQMAIRAMVSAIRDLNESPLRSRELSIALTNFETGALWLERAIEDERAVREALTAMT